jgi:hypothetical protein
LPSRCCSRAQCYACAFDSLSLSFRAKLSHSSPYLTACTSLQSRCRQYGLRNLARGDVPDSKYTFTLLIGAYVSSTAHAIRSYFNVHLNERQAGTTGLSLNQVITPSSVCQGMVTMHDSARVNKRTEAYAVLTTTRLVSQNAVNQKGTCNIISLRERVAYIHRPTAPLAIPYTYKSTSIA